MDGLLIPKNNIKKGLIYIAFCRKIKGRRFKTIAPYNKEMMQGKKNNLPPKAPEHHILDETFTGLFKTDKPKFKLCSWFDDFSLYQKLTIIFCSGCFAFDLFVILYTIFT